jgi:hypothetical protein
MQDLTSLVYNFKSKGRSEWPEMLDMVAELMGELAPALVEMADHMDSVSPEMDADTMLRMFVTRLETACAAHRYQRERAAACEHGPCCN